MEGAELLRRLKQDGIAPDIARLSDEPETELSVALSGTGGVGRKLLAGRCLLVCGWEGASAARPRRGRSCAAGPGRWARSRAAPGRRRASPGRTCATTCSTAACSSRRWRRRRPGAGWRRSTTRSGARWTACTSAATSRTCIPTGASLYFTILGAQAADPAAQWRSLKDAATRAIVAAGGTITHHHALGRDHTPYLGAEIGDFGLELLRAVKERCDPAGIMNPGKVVDFAGSRLS